MKKATHDLFCKIFSSLEPPPNLTLSQWADRYREIPQGSANAGRWDTSKAPYQREIMDAITDIHIKKVVVMSAAQVGKTDAFILNTIGFFMQYDPAPIMVMEPTIVMAEGLSKARLALMLQDTAVLRGKVDTKSRTSGNTILQKNFPGGYVVLVGANSPASLAMRPIRILLADEIDRYPNTAGNEGDPLSLAEKRQTTFWNRKEVNISTPTAKGASRIEVEFQNSTMEEWNVPCPVCGALQPLVWDRVVYDPKNLDEISYTCEKCGCVSGEIEWKEHFSGGKYVAEHPERPVRGFHLNSLASTFFGWRKIVEDYIKAAAEKEKGNHELMKTWVNTELGLTYEEEAQQMEAEVLMKRREKYGCEVPQDVICLTAGVDTQDDRFEIEVVGWGVEKESWGIVYKKIMGDLKQPEPWEELEKFLSQTFTREDGTKLRIACTCMDSQGHFFNEVCKFCKTKFARRIFAIRGVGGSDKPYTTNATKNNRQKCPVFSIGVDTGKALLFQRLAVEVEGPGYCHFPSDRGRGYSETYFRGLTAEKMEVQYNKKKAKAVVSWVLKDPGYRRNEPLDLRNYAGAALELTGLTLKPSTKATAGPQTGARKGRGSRSGGVI